jgi:hypothetical protein
MREDKSIIKQFIDNLDRITSPIHIGTILKLKNITEKLLIRIYRKNLDLIDEKEITSDGEYAIFNKIPQSGNYLLEFVNEHAFYKVEVQCR